MSRSIKRMLLALAVLVALALVCPNYSFVHVSGPDGTVTSQRVSFGLSRVRVDHRVTPEESTVTIEHD
jgi:hypothetical protein